MSLTTLEQWEEAASTLPVGARAATIEIIEEDLHQGRVVKRSVTPVTVLEGTAIVFRRSLDTAAEVLQRIDAEVLQRIEELEAAERQAKMLESFFSSLAAAFTHLPAPQVRVVNELSEKKSIEFLRTPSGLIKSAKAA